MDDESPSRDDALLARLNNLKPSSVSFGSSSSLSPPSGASELNDTPEDLLARFEKLYGRKSTDHQEASPLANFIPDDESRPPSPTIEELLAQLDSQDQYRTVSADLVEGKELIAEAKRTLPVEHSSTQDTKSRRSDTSRSRSPGQSTRSIEREQSEEAEAEASLQRILDEAELEQQQEPVTPVSSKDPGNDPASQDPVPPDSFASLVFPSIPDTPLPSSALPSTPTAAPSTRKQRAQKSGFSDKEIDSWCIICCANATVKCFGCDGDLYCWGCWREGHVGDDVGLEEKTHVWERVMRRKG